jgi:outer membrane phospholipase A
VSGALGAPEMVLTPPAEAGHVDGEVRFDVLVTNAAATPQPFRAADTLSCRLTTRDGVADVVARRLDGEAERTIPAGGFIRIPYVATLTTAGRVVIELRDQPGATVVNVIPAGAAVSRQEAARLPATRSDNPFSILTAQDPNFQREMGLVEFLSYRVKAHEPVYIVAGNEDPSTKFQFSFKYQIFDPVGPVAQKLPPLAGFYFGYSQTSFWDLGNEEDSNPFYDSSYRPELMVSYDNLDRYLLDGDGGRHLPSWVNFGFQAGLKHESNGQSQPDSRSVNVVYARPIVTFEGKEGWFVTVAPSVWAYVFDMSDNEDIEEYRGYGELRLVAGRAGGLQLAATGRLGEGGGQGSVLVDLTYPIRGFSFGNLDAYLDVQYFSGYGESILNYNQNNESLRFGISLVR